MSNIQWDIRHNARAWSVDELNERFFSAPEKLEMVDAKFDDYDEELLHMLGCLLENMGADATVRLGDSQGVARCGDGSIIPRCSP